MDARINLNDTVYVVLTENGWNILRKHYDDIYSIVPNMSQEFKDKEIESVIDTYRRVTKTKFIDAKPKEVTEMQLHTFMNIFGPEAYNGNGGFIENNAVYLSFPK